MTARIVGFVLVAGLAACGSGTIRPAGDAGPGSPAPSPAPSPAVADPAPATTSPAAPPPQPYTGYDEPQPANEVEVRRIGRWVSSGVSGPRRLVIRDPATWSRFWSELGAGVQPQVDFSRDVVIAVASGERSSGGHDITVQRVTRTGGDLRIEVLETSPGPGCVTTGSLTQPVDVVLVPADSVTGWSFVDRSESAGC